ncbi:DUF5005 domain-containing protein [Actinocatenispora rupis]|uniref:DUF4185 domain-containing protein n=1 Tax=Actinocatenispora rupis TaxID=519421 RepID=A0A8J3J0Y3_9ACTN|nr:DUF5005 domain-containing protein [Actinocatenispora rupis]GID09496.1 hypothetical protein Aru02nite_03850 [Actinocatenispora rupis]
MNGSTANPLGRRTLLAGAVAVPLGAALGLGRGGSPAAAAGRRPGSLTVTGAAPDRGLTTLFDGYSDSGVGWTGADSTYSVRLPDGRIVWIFSDTFLGPVHPDGSRPQDTPFLNNSFVVQQGSRLTTVHGGTADAPEALLPPDDDGWYWAGAGMVGAGTLNVTYHQFHRTGTGIWDFAWLRSVLARFTLDTLTLIDVTPLPSDVPNLESASWLLSTGGHTYAYRVEDLGSDKYLHVARVAGDDLRAPWRFWTGSGWSADQTASTRVQAGVSNEYSVTRVGSEYLLLTQDTTELLSPHVVAYSAATPTGPFTGRTAVYTTPETGADGSYHNGNVYTYNPHVHPELSSARELLVSYNVNSFDNQDLYGDVSIYRPRFVRVTLGSAGGR